MIPVFLSSSGQSDVTEQWRFNSLRQMQWKQWKKMSLIVTGQFDGTEQIFSSLAHYRWHVACNNTFHPARHWILKKKKSGYTVKLWAYWDKLESIMQNSSTSILCTENPCRCNSFPFLHKAIFHISCKNIHTSQPKYHPSENPPTLHPVCHPSTHIRKEGTTAY